MNTFLRPAAFLLAAALPLALPPAAAVAGPAAAKAKAPAPTLEEAIEKLRRETGVNIVPMWNAIEQAGIKRDAPVEVDIKRATAAQYLRLALGAVSAGKEADNRLDFVVDNGIVIIAPRKLLAEQQVETRAYEAADVAMKVPNFTDAPSLSLTSVLPSAQK